MKRSKDRSGVSNERSFALQDLVDSVFASCSRRQEQVSPVLEQVSSDLPRLWIGVDEDSDGTPRRSSARRYLLLLANALTIDLLIPRARAIVPYPRQRHASFEPQRPGAWCRSSFCRTYATGLSDARPSAVLDLI